MAEQTTVKRTGRCPECWGMVSVHPSGLVAWHDEWLVGPGASWHQGDKRCSGSGKKPRTEEVASRG